MWPFSTNNRKQPDSNPKCLSLLQDVECESVVIKGSGKRGAVFHHYTEGDFSVYVSVSGPEVSEAHVEPGPYRLRLMLWPR